MPKMNEVEAQEKMQKWLGPKARAWKAVGKRAVKCRVGALDEQTGAKVVYGYGATFEHAIRWAEKNVAEAVAAEKFDEMAAKVEKAPLLSKVPFLRGLLGARAK